MATIQNPILPGFNPDPSILRVGDDYYIATSTFEFFPGVQIHHSKDLVNWKLIGHPLTRTSQLDLKGVPGSGGIWAPCLTYDNGTYYLIYTNVVHHAGIYKDVHNYLVTAKHIQGPWSEPIYLNSSGFDPSLFHEDTGRKWIVNVNWEFRAARPRFGGIVLQEYSEAEQKLVGEPQVIFKGTEFRITEGPHLYQRNGYYYMITAEGGTDHNHVVTLARSKSLTGPYEVCPWNPILTSRFDPTHPLQKAGHADLVETQTGEWYMVHLCSRPLPHRGRSILGRETAIQKVEWTEDGWIRLATGGHTPALEVPAPALPAHPWPAEPARDDFDTPKLSPHYATMRITHDEKYLSLTARPGHLRLYGRESLSSRHEQVSVLRRQQAFVYEAVTSVDMNPISYQQMAGIVALHDTHNYHYLYVSLNDDRRKVVNVVSTENNVFTFPISDHDVDVDGWERVYMRARVRYDKLQVAISRDGQEWMNVGPQLEVSMLSDEASRDSNFTGAFIGMACQDLAGRGGFADFDFFEYREDQSLKL